MSCVLRITGNSFDVDGFLKDSGLVAYLQYKAGDPIGFKRKGKETYDTNGASFDLSNAAFDDFETQKSDAIHFLTTHFNKLKNLRNFGLEAADIPEIDFAIESDALTYPVQSDYLQAELLKLAGDLGFGIMISHYDKSCF